MCYAISVGRHLKGVHCKRSLTAYQDRHHRFPALSQTREEEEESADSLLAGEPFWWALWFHIYPGCDLKITSPSSLTAVWPVCPSDRKDLGKRARRQERTKGVHLWPVWLNRRNWRGLWTSVRAWGEQLAFAWGYSFKARSTFDWGGSYNEIILGYGLADYSQRKAIIKGHLERGYFAVSR